MPKAKDSRKAKSIQETKTVRLNRLGREMRELQEKIAQYEFNIQHLNIQYTNEANTRSVFTKATGKQLSEAYDKHASATAQLSQKQALYNSIETEPESSSSDESMHSKSSFFSRRSGSSKSSNPAVIGWDCGNCNMTNFSDPDGFDNRCACGHQFCQDEVEVEILAGQDRDGIDIFRTELVSHCSVQWDPQ